MKQGSIVLATFAGCVLLGACASTPTADASARAEYRQEMNNERGEQWHASREYARQLRDERDMRAAVRTNDALRAQRVPAQPGNP